MQNSIMRDSNMKVTLLGTSCMVPTKERNAAATYLEYNGQGLLFDCGEGTQRQMNFAGISRHDTKRIFISHWHADHTAGLLGMLQTMSNVDKEHVSVEIYGPVDTKARLEMLMAATISEQTIEINVHELAPSNKIALACETDSYKVEYISLEHTTPCVGYRFVEKDRLRIKVNDVEKLGIPQGPILGKLQEGKDVEWKGKKLKAADYTYTVHGKVLAIVMDTAFCPQAIDIARDADLLISEATFTKAQEEKAIASKHMTSTQSAQVAAMSNAKKLVLTHISQRYKNPADIIDEAKDIFPDTQIGFDLMTIKL